MRADRLLTALLLLQAHRRLTGRELAERLEVSARTVHRDMEALSAAGVPVMALRGVHGGWSLQENWRTQVPGLDEAELRALLMSQPGLIGNRPMAVAAERALGKLVASLPTALRDRAASIRERLYVDPSGWRASTENLAALPRVQQAVSDDRQLVIHYRKSGGEALERTVEPLGLVAKGNTWYLVAHTSDGYRTFRVSRIERAEVLDRPCRRPRNFNLAAHWAMSTERFDRNRGQYQVTLRVEPHAARSVVTYQAAEILHGHAATVPPDWVTMNIRFDREDEALFVCLGLGSRATILEPAHLRARVEAEAAAILRAAPPSS